MQESTLWVLVQKGRRCSLIMALKEEPNACLQSHDMQVFMAYLIPEDPSSPVVRQITHADPALMALPTLP